MRTSKEQRRANARSHSTFDFAAWAKAQPEISIEEAFAPGQVTHACYSHDSHCKTLKTGNGFDCNCNPDVSFHRQT
jgi:hypothetical protein